MIRLILLLREQFAYSFIIATGLIIFFWLGYGMRYLEERKKVAFNNSKDKVKK